MDLEKSLEGLKKFLEGWVAHRNELTKTWKKYWMVLKGNFIFLFTSEKTNKENLDGTLNLGSGTYVADIKSRKGFKFELTTLNHRREAIKNVFKFSKEDDFHLWKVYILAIATGTIPSDVKLLPGQRLDIYEAIVEVNRHHPGPPPSGLSPRRSSCPGGPTTNGARRPSEPSTRAIHEQMERLENDEDEMENDPVLQQIRVLRRRQEIMAEKSIGGINLASSTATLSSAFDPLIEIPIDPMGPPTMHTGQSMRSMSSQGSHGKTSNGQRSSSGSQGQKSTSSPGQRSSFLSSPHPFYPETTGNNNSADVPSWFVNCSRDQAEEILTATKKLGTVLMRGNSRFPVTGNYVISFRRELEGKIVVSHYNVIRSPEGFKIDVENQHDAMTCLSGVMEFFLSVAGATARPLTSNDLTQLLGKYQATAFPTVNGINDAPVEMRSHASPNPSPSSSTSSSAHKPRQRIDAFASSPIPTPIPTPPGSNRSSSVQSSTGSTSSRTSRVSFDFSSRRPSDPHHGYTRQSSSTASSGVFNAGGSVSSAPGPQRSAFSCSPYSGSLQDSVYNEAVPVSPDAVKFVEHGSAPLRGTTSVPNDLEVYTNHAEVTLTGSTGTAGTLTQNRRGSQPTSISGSSKSQGSHGFGSHVNRGPLQGTNGSGTLKSTYGTGPPPSTYGSGTSPSTYGSGPPPSTYGSGTSPGTYRSGTSSSTYGSGPSPGTYGSGPSPSTYGSGTSPSTYGSDTFQSTRVSEGSSILGFPLQSTCSSDMQSTRSSNSQSSLRADTQSTLSTKGGFGQRGGPPGKTPPPAPPPKPSAQEIYIMMKPVRTPEADHDCRSEVAEDAYGQSTVEEPSGAQMSVKDLARMLQCAVTSGK